MRIIFQAESMQNGWFLFFGVLVCFQFSSPLLDDK